MRFQRESFDALLSLSEAAPGQTDVAGYLNRAVPTIRAVTGFQTIAVRLYRKEANCFHLRAQRGLSDEMIDALSCLPGDLAFVRKAIATQQAVLAPVREEYRRTMGYRTVIFVPLLARGKAVGSIELATSEDQRWSRDQLRWLTQVGRTIGTQIDHLQQSDRLRHLALDQERTHIAQEIHDGLSQLLNTASLWIDQAQQRLDAGEAEDTRAALAHAEQVTRDALLTVRDEMFGLRELVAEEEDLVTTLAACLRRFERQWGIKANLVLDGEGVYDRFRLLSPDAECQLLRIVQEGLSNVRRHSRGSQVTVSAVSGDDALVLTVEDDGVGFDPETVGFEHLGLRVMRERAESVGGHLTIESGLCRGTRIRLELSHQQPWNGL